MVKVSERVNPLVAKRLGIPQEPVPERYVDRQVHSLIELRDRTAVRAQGDAAGGRRRHCRLVRVGSRPVVGWASESRRAGCFRRDRRQRTSRHRRLWRKRGPVGQPCVDASSGSPYPMCRVWPRPPSGVGVWPQSRMSGRVASPARRRWLVASSAARPQQHP